MESKHVSIWIAAPPETVYRFAADPQTWPRWAAGLAQGGLRQTPSGWVADSPMGEVTVEFSPRNDLGVLDHVVRLPTGEAVYNPMRVQPWSVPTDADEAHSEVVFSVRRRPEMTDEEFDADTEAVAADLATLKRLLED
ncbi:SRPBCC family protein [Mycolicibacterium novocastrense]|uniref:Polyketide cyclase / dehydrase and lipid transport n=1 Tax=Mycolicibacterium novocastrense TaxID=59813 RepID=A0AAW5SJF3_MYCNV|nr:SRPBCC family protein [Mycolicibacterium novocastrense]MCV7023899.1 SRPBCC family protein [Mycolicibacterium novocastrense]GAT09500.1 polyketide cyclase / dehydrase and lipid transport [Mycolicibacterium novocastrense]